MEVYIMKILHILNSKPDASTEKIINVQKSGNEVKIIELYKGGVNYDSLVKDVFDYDRVFCW